MRHCVAVGGTRVPEGASPCLRPVRRIRPIRLARNTVRAAPRRRLAPSSGSSRCRRRSPAPRRCRTSASTSRPAKLTPRRPQRLGQVHPHQGPVRVPQARPGRPSVARRRARRRRRPRPRPVRCTRPGLSFVHQDLGLVLELNTMDNLALHGGFNKGRFGRVTWRSRPARPRRLLEPFGLELDITTPLSKATPVERTIIAIAAALQGWSDAGGVLVLDEPTAVLPPGEVGRLFTIVRDLQGRGAGILYVSHRLDEIFELCEEVTVLRNGELVACEPVAGLTKGRLVHLMLGVEMEPDYRAPVPETGQRPAAARRGWPGRHLPPRHDLHALRGRGARHRRAARLGARRAAPAAHGPSRARQRRPASGSVPTLSGSRSRSGRRRPSPSCRRIAAERASSAR